MYTYTHNRKATHTTRKGALFVGVLLVAAILASFVPAVTKTQAAPNYQLNYQGKLTNAANVTVANGSYNMRFWIATSTTAATTSALWTETLTGTNKVTVTNGLFSVMLGSTSPLSSVDFNQTLYLGVEIGGTSTPAWDGEMSPRKVLGAVPAAFEAKNASTVGGVASTSFLRSDADDTASGLLTFTGGLISNASTTITNLTSLIATTTTLVINGESFTDLTGSGLLNTGNALTCATANSATFGCLAAADWSVFNEKVSSTSINTLAKLETLTGVTNILIEDDIDASSELLALLDDETGTAGSLVFSGNPLLQGFRSNASSTIGDGTGAGGLTILGNSTTTGNAYFAGNVGIGTTTPSSKLNIYNGNINIDGNQNYLSIRNNTNTTLGTVWYEHVGNNGCYDGYFGIGTSSSPCTLPAIHITPAGAVTANYGYGVADGKTISSASSGSLAYYKPFDGSTMGEIAFRGAAPGKGIFNFKGYYNNGSWNSNDVMTLVSSSTGSFVGIGSTTPSRKLTVQGGDSYFGGNVTATGTLRTGASGEPGRWRFYDSSGYLMSFWDTSTDYDTWGLYWDTTNNKFIYRGNGTDRVSIDLDDGGAYFQGNVGIGSTTPSRALTVEGEGYFTGLNVRSTSTLGSATATNLYATNASTSVLFGAGLADCDVSATSKLLWDAATGKFSCGSDQAGTGADGVSNWSLLGTALTPTTTSGTYGIRVNASSTIGNGTGAGGLTINGGATTTGNAVFGGTIDLNLTQGLLTTNSTGLVSASTTIGDGIISDILTIGTGSTVVDGALSANVSLLGSTIGATELASADFGEFTCNGTTCTLDAESQSIEELSDVGAMTESFGDLLAWNGTGWTNRATSTLGFIASTSLDTSLKLSTLITDETGSGNLVFSVSPTFTGTAIFASTTITNATSTYLFATNLRATNATIGSSAGVLTTNTSGLVAASTTIGDGYISDSLTLTNSTGLPISTGVSGLGSNVATFLATPSSANLASALTDETGSGFAVFSYAPTFTGTVAFNSFTTTGTSTLGNATATTLYATTASTSALYGAGLADCDVSATSKLLWDAATGKFSCGSDQAGTGADGVSNWVLLGTALTPTTTSGTYGIRVNASSTIGNGTGAGGLTILGTATTTNLKVTSLTASRAIFTDANNLLTSSGVSQYLIDSLSDETGTGSLVFNNAPTFTGTAAFNALTVSATSTLGYASTTALTVSGNSYFNFASSSYASTTGITATNAYFNQIGIGTSSLSARLSIRGLAGYDSLRIASSTGTSTFAVLANGNVEVANNLINAGVTWTTRSAPAANTWISVAYGNGTFVAVSLDGTNRIMTSPDGVTWTARTAPETNNWYSVTYGNGLFVVVGQSGTNRIMTSPDGITWTPRPAVEANQWYSVTYGNGLFVAVSGNGTNRVMTSPDGITWTGRTAAEANTWLSVTYGDGLFVAVGALGTGANAIMTSSNGIDWITRTSPEANTWNSVTYGNGKFVAVAGSGTNRVMTSSDGIIWTASSIPAYVWYSVTYGDGLFVATGANNQVLTSSDAANWTLRNPVIANSWYSVTYGAGRFVTVGLGTNSVMTSGNPETSALAHNNIYQGGMSILGGAFNIGTSTATTSSFFNNIINVASTTGTSLLTMLKNGFMGLGSSTPSRLLTVSGDIYSTGNITAASSTLGNATSTSLAITGISGSTQCLRVNASGVVSGTGTDCGSGAGDGMSNWSLVNGALTPTTTTATYGIRVNASSTIGDGTGAGGLTILGNSTTTGNTYLAGLLGIGTTSPSAMLSVTADANTNLFNFASSTGSSLLSLNARGALMFGTTTTADIFINGGATSTVSDTNKNNVAIGNQAFSYYAGGAQDNIALGYQALYGSSSVPMTGSVNFAAGYQSLMNNTSGSYNTALSYLALTSNTSGSNNNAIGQYSLRFNTSGSDNNGLGKQALYSNTSGSDNNAFGNGALILNSTGSRNNTLGTNALYQYNGTGSIAIGYKAGYNQTLGDNNIVIGYDVNLASTTGSNQLSIGNLIYGSGLDGTGSTVSGGNIGIGSSSPSRRLTVQGDIYALNNIRAASSTLGNATSTSLAITGISGSTQCLRVNASGVVSGTGADCGSGAGDGMSNWSLVNGALTPTTTTATYGIRVNASSTIGDGTGAGGLTILGNSTTTGNTYLAGLLGVGTSSPSAMLSITAAANTNLFNFASSTGSSLLSLNTRGALMFGSTTNANIFLNGGATSTVTDTNGKNIAIGNEAFSYYATGATKNIALGQRALYGSSSVPMTGDDNFAAGYFALSGNTTGLYNTAIGLLALEKNTTGAANFAVGYRALGRNISGYGNNAFGYDVLNANTTGSYNNALGSDATMVSNTTGSYNNAFGYGVLAGNTTGSHNNVMGYNALNDNTTGSYNNAFGYNSLFNYNGTGTIAIGYRAGDALVSGSNNIIIGYDIDFQTTAATNTLNIGNLLFGTGLDGTGTTLSSGNIGIGSSSPSRKLTVSGDIYSTGNLTAASSTLGNATSTSLAITGISGSTQCLRVNASGVVSGTGADCGSGAGDGMSNWSLVNGALTPTTTTATYGIRVNASSTIGDGTGAGGLTILGNSTTTGNMFFLGNMTAASSTATSTFYDVKIGSTVFTDARRNDGSIAIGTGNNLGGNTNAGNFILGQSNTTDSYSDYVVGRNNTLTSGATSGFVFGHNNTISSSNSFIIGRNITNSQAETMQIGLSETAKIVLRDTGKMGLGSTTPSRTLTVEGEGYFTGLNVRSTSTLGYASTTAVSGTNAYLTYASTTGLTATNAYLTNLTFGAAPGVLTLNASGVAAASTTIGDSYITDALTVTGGTIGSNTIASGAAWSTAGTLTIGDGGDQIDINSNSWDVTNGLMTGLTGITANGSSTLGGGTQTTGLTINGGATTTEASYIAKSLRLGTTSPQYSGTLLTMSSSTIYGSDVPVAGIKQFFGFRNATLNSVFYGNETYITSTSSATSTLVGGMIRIADTSTTSNTVRGFEAQAYRGTNTQGENTGLSGFGRTFGVRGTTLGDAGSVYLPAGVFAESQGTVQGNALRAYSGTITSEDLVSIFHDTSNFIGAGIQMNFGNAGGSFAATSTAKFLDLQVAGTSKFVVSANGSTTIGDGTTNASLMIPRGGICVDNDGSCISTTTGQISARVYVTGATDLAEMYFSNESLAAGEIVALSGGLSIDRADETNKAQIIGVVASNPGIVLGEGDKSLVPGEGSYPVGLKGRLPIKLSTENGPIHKGDRITLSSIPGVGMKATASSRVVGIALEDFDGSRAYSAGYLDQYGDRMVTEKITKSVMIDPKTQDGCYMGGGSALGEAGCDPEAVKSTTLQTTTDTSAYDTALAALTNQPAATTTTAGGTVTQVGQAIMFIELADYQIASESLVLAELATTTALSADVNDTLWNRLKSLATNFVDGVLTIAGIKADRVEVGSELCVDGVCVTADDLRALLQSAGRPSEGSGSTTGGGAAPAPTPEPELPAPEPTPVEEGGGTGGGSEAPVTDPVPTTEEPAGSAPVEPVVEATPVVEEPTPAPEPEAPQPEPSPSI